MDTKHKSRIVLVGIASLLATTALFAVATTRAYANDTPSFYGLVSAKPDSGNIGTWTIGGKTVTANAATGFEFEFGQLNIGTCAKVRYIMSGASLVADEIESQTASDCQTGSGDGTPKPPGTSVPGTPVPGATPGIPDGVRQVFRGVLNSRPDGKVGTWVVGGKAFTAVDATELDIVEGALNTGACVKVRFVTNRGIDVALEIDSEPAGDCSIGATPVPSGTIPTPVGTITATNEFRGKLIARPEGLLGEWTIGEKVFIATNTTEFKSENGDLVVGACLKVHYATLQGTNIAREIESEESSDCARGTQPKPRRGDDERRDSKVFALVEALPAAPYIGEWKIGGVTYQANSQTRLKLEHGVLDVGACVRAEFAVMNGVNVLSRVDVKEIYKCNGKEAGEPSKLPKAYGVIDVFTTTKPSTWVVSGITYTVPATASLEAEHGPFAVGAFVEVKYVIDGDTRVALKIETHVAPNKGEGNETGKLTGRPSDDWGTWVINGQSYIGDAAIKVDLDDATARVASATAVTGQRVMVNYYTSGGVRYATAIQQARSSLYLPSVEMK